MTTSNNIQLKITTRQGSKNAPRRDKKKFHPLESLASQNVSRVNHLHKHIEKGSLLKKKVPTSLMLLELTKADHNRTSWISAHLLYSPSLHIELTLCGTFSTDVAQILLMYSFTVGLPVSHLVSRPVSDASTHTIYKGSSSRFRGVRYIFC